MSSHAAELTTIRTLVEDLQARVLTVARSYEKGEREDLVRALFEAERSLRSADRHLARAEKVLA